MTVTRESMRLYVSTHAHLVTRRESVRYPGLYVLKYKRKVFFDNLWNEHLEECRGAVVDADYNFVVRPFTKIYNRFENKTDIDRDEMALAIQKINGFMCAATYVPRYDDVIVSTTGSLDSEFVAMAEKYFTPEVKAVIKSYYKEDDGPLLTWIFEVCDPADPHIVAETPGLWLIGLQNAEYGSPYSSDYHLELKLDKLAKELGVHRPWWFRTKFGDIVDLAKITRKEGYVVYGDVSRTALKIKSPHYLMSKFFGRMSEKKLSDILTNPKGIRARIDEEFYPVVDYMAANADLVKSMDEQTRIKFVQDFFEREIYKK